MFLKNNITINNLITKSLSDALPPQDGHLVGHVEGLPGCQRHVLVTVGLIVICYEEEQ